MAVTLSCSGRISVWRSSPPRLAAPATRMNETTPARKITIDAAFDSFPVRRSDHRPRNARAPVIWIATNARNAAPSCVSAMLARMSSMLSMAAHAALPVT